MLAKIYIPTILGKEESTMAFVRFQSYLFVAVDLPVSVIPSYQGTQVCQYG
jgi:hypothetical protein